jgi:alkylation response protein AidB-like acyl-CoA dehydrogenase
MDFALSDEQSAIFDMAKAVGADHIAPHARTWEQAGTMPRTLWPHLAALGFGGLYVPEAAGGTGLSRLDSTLVFEALAMSCPSVAAFLSIHNMSAAMIARHGSDAMKAALLPGAISMDRILSYCLTEPGSGSDAAALRTKAQRTDTGWALTGTKAFISGGNYSDAYIVMARSGGDGAKGISAFVVEAGTPGLSFGAPEDKMGWRCQPTCQVQFDDCVIPEGNLLGAEGMGFAYAMEGLDGGRLNIAACSLGGAQAALDATLGYMASGRPSANESTSFRRCNSASPTWRSRCRPPAPSSAKPHGSSTPRPPTPPPPVRWPRSSSPRSAAGSPTNACNCTAAMVIWPTTASRKSCATCGSTRSSKAQTRSCACSSPAI